ncbi:sensor histidine kinase [Microbacterium flavum]|uniref:histidine kinase n=1 Tax=Microbacterium flavum TaxID=415216 RepID=A0ABS5XQM2_9MICO|nr:histidine kinase [Microbacterium flavum]MBT8796813.1 hypothetical protein [Microbacterium flavum]
MREHTAPTTASARPGLVSTVMDAVIVAALLVLAAAVWALDPQGSTVPEVLLSAVAIVALLWRRRFPLAVFAVTAVVGILSAALGHGGTVALPIGFAGAAVVQSGRRGLGAALTGAAAAVLVGVLLVRGARWDDSAVVASVSALALGVTIGLVQDARRRTLQEAVGRAERAEALRTAEAERAVAEERLRIARELHDVLAHRIAVIGVQTGLAQYVIDEDPAAARAALETARAASGSALDELATLLRLLRRGDESAQAMRSPAPSLERLDGLLADIRRTGLTVHARVPDAVPALAPAVDLAAYRVVQEGLTNAHKHGDGAARLEVRVEGSRLVITVRNGVPAPSAVTETPAASTGLGLVGMRERVEAMGGLLSVRAAPEEFGVRAELPIQDRPTTKGEPR